MGKTYRQFCPIAHALDLVGERWALLVVRELMDGPLRYTDLLERLHGCGTNILAARLRHLEQAGVVQRRRLPPPAASTVYELTPVGENLRPVLDALCHWGLRTLGPPTEDAELVPGWLERAISSAAMLLPEDRRLTFRIGDEVASIAQSRSVGGALADAQAVVEGDPDSFYGLIVHGDLTGMAIQGDPELVEQFVQAFAQMGQAGAPVAV
jgi:DNA-binding HxlR family transcriptional regulator